jgi:hypothetical protein
MIQIAACFLEYVAQLPVLRVIFEILVAHVLLPGAIAPQGCRPALDVQSTANNKVNDASVKG